MTHFTRDTHRPLFDGERPTLDPKVDYTDFFSGLTPMTAEPPRPDMRPVPEAISHQASVRFALMQGSNPTRAEREDLAAWLAADPLHAQAYAALQAQWAASTPADRHPPPVIPYELSRRCVIGLGIAAGALAVTAGAGSVWLKGVGLPLADERSAVGERRVLQLPDGSTAELSADTALDLDFSAGKRSVRLLKGQATALRRDKSESPGRCSA